MRQGNPPEETGGPEHGERPRETGDEGIPEVTAEPDDPDPYARRFAIDELTGPGDEE